MSELDSEEDFNLVKPEAMTCSAYYSWPLDWRINGVLPFKISDGRCYTGTGGTCDDKYSDNVRLCACLCGAGSSQPLSGIARSCTMYVPIAVGGTQREPFFHAPSTLRRNRSRAARWPDSRERPVIRFLLPPC